jgi:hypothetical protein
MPNPSKQKKFFAFITSLIITIVVGYFAWSALSSVGGDLINKVLSYTDKISAKIFTASAPDDGNLDSPADFHQEDVPPVEQDEADNVEVTDADSPNFVLTADEQRQNLLDDIQEKLDVINQQVQELAEQWKANDHPAYKDEPQDIDNQNLDDTEPKDDVKVVIYPKVLISEIQILPIERRFVELYNPNDFQVDLTDWHIQRKTKTADSWSSFIPSAEFGGKIIPAYGYFLISRQFANSDITLDLTLSPDNCLVLKNPNGEISDKLGFGDASDQELLSAQNPSAGQSTGRKVLSDGTEEETDNNFYDFEIQTPTPKYKNITYTQTQTTTAGGGGAIPAVYTKILISEAQLDPVGQRFIELYNPSAATVDLTGWYLQRKTGTSKSWSSLVSSSKFAEKSILASGYY